MGKVVATRFRSDFDVYISPPEMLPLCNSCPIMATCTGPCPESTRYLNGKWPLSAAILAREEKGEAEVDDQIMTLFYKYYEYTTDTLLVSNVPDSDNLLISPNANLFRFILRIAELEAANRIGEYEGALTILDLLRKDRGLVYVQTEGYRGMECLGELKAEVVFVQNGIFSLEPRAYQKGLRFLRKKLAKSKSKYNDTAVLEIDDNTLLITSRYVSPGDIYLIWQSLESGGITASVWDSQLFIRA